MTRGNRPYDIRDHAGECTSQTLSERIAQWVGEPIDDGLPRWSRDIATSLARLTTNRLAANKDPARQLDVRSKRLSRWGFNPGIEPLGATPTLSGRPAVYRLRCALKRLGQRPAKNPMERLDSSAGLLARGRLGGDDDCWTLHGRPRGRKPGVTRGRRPNRTTAMEESVFGCQDRPIRLVDGRRRAR
ncbi:hypothetical protein ASPCADRAFT_4137 [Aspergillus carbonarius ITEM 5010]|uniref:Uncharacterized protein n=1 Tax=Aspergillus carbonarius (strain ITEM 5010) TaxID=602072 RepID=A0A1R3RSQ7_ASPC5|nr:hypothetical protein ASPCADRAFT_4137 [Aspergillus carbonarius ITEM 5010]